MSKNFLDYIRENSTLDLGDDVDKNLTMGDVHVPAAGGDDDKKKKKTKETLISVLTGNMAPVSAAKGGGDEIESATFDAMGSDDRSFDYWIEKLKLKQKVTLDCDPNELKALLASNPQLAAAVAQALSAVGKADSRCILLMRHGATHLNSEDTSVDRIRGQKDVPLSPEGKEEAVKLAEKVAKDPPDCIFSSDLSRAADTAKMVAAASDLKFGKDNKTKGLRPWDVGTFAGKKSKEAVPILCDYAINKPDQAVPEGESFNDFYGRFTGELSDILKKNSGVVGIVSHHRNERVLRASEKSGWKPGEMDGKEFSKKGEGTAGFEIVEIPQSWLDGVAGGKVAKFVGEPVDLSKVWQDTHDGPVVKSFQLNVCKVDADQQIFYGWAYVSEENGQIVIDKQDDYIIPADLLKAAEEFTLHGGKLGDMHDARNVGRVVASFCTTEELCKAFGLSVQDNRRGWILGFKVDDPEVWQKIKSGGQLELSIGGRGERVEWETEDGQPHVRQS